LTRLGETRVGACRVLNVGVEPAHTRTHAAYVVMSARLLDHQSLLMVGPKEQPRIVVSDDKQLED
jgi:hypothetical protein